MMNLKAELLTQDDIDGIKNYSQYFEVELSESLSAAIDGFKKSNLQSKEMVVVEIMKWILTSPHESFQDKLWSGTKQKATEELAKLGIQA